MKFKYHVLFLPKLVLYWFYLLTKFIPRQNNKWVFGSHFGFRDNSKFLLFDAKDNHPEIRPIWISHNKNEITKIISWGVECYHWLSPFGLYHCLTAKVYVCTQTTMDINTYTSGNAVYLNLNHGVGIKKCYWQRPEYMSKVYKIPVSKLNHSFIFKILGFRWYFRTPDICLVPSKTQAQMFFCPMFRIPMDKILYANFPRNELLRWDEQKVKCLAQKYEPPHTIEFMDFMKRFNKVYIYMPTWRNDGSDFLSASGIDFKKLNESLKKNNDLFILKLHPLTRISADASEGFSNIIQFPKDSDVYYVLSQTDCLITDYSSIYSDYVLMDKEIILFPFDMDRYLSKSTSLGEYDKYYIGRRVFDFNELINVIINRDDCHLYRKDYDFLMNFYWSNIKIIKDIVEEVKSKYF